MNYLLSFYLMFGTSLVYGQEVKFFNALENNNISSVAHLLSDQVELSVKGIHKGSEKQEVIKELRAWAKNAQLSSVRSIHEGVAENKSSHFKIATAKSRKETFRIFVYVQEDEGKQKIKKIKIDK